MENILNKQIGFIYIHAAFPLTEKYLIKNLEQMKYIFNLFVIGIYDRTKYKGRYFSVDDESHNIFSWQSLSACWNLGILRCLANGIENFIISNDDIILNEICLSNLINHLKDFDFISALPTEELRYNSGIILPEYFNKKSFEIDYRSYESNSMIYGKSLDDFVIDVTKLNRGIIAKNRLIGSLFATKLQTVKDCGLFDLRYEPCFWEDIDMQEKMKLAEKNFGIAMDCFFHHFIARTSHVGNNNNFGSTNDFMIRPSWIKRQ